MALAKKNSQDRKQPEDKNGSSIEPKSATVAPLDGLLNLLVDLSFRNQTEQTPVESLNGNNEAAGVVDGLSKEPEAQYLEDTQELEPAQKSSNQQQNGNGSSSDTNSLRPAATLDGLLNLLIDGQVVKETEETPVELLKGNNDAERVFEELSKDLEAQQLQDEQAEISKENKLPSAIALDEDEAEAPKKTAISSAIALDDEQAKDTTLDDISDAIALESDDSEVALDRLRNLLLTPELADSKKLMISFREKIASLEHKIYQPAELINLLLPLIGAVLTRSIAEAKEEVVEAIAPVIDQMIHTRTEQDKLAMGSALAPLIATAISRQINDSPDEIAKAIGPTMGKAIKEQVSVERDSMVDALYPVIGSTIAKYMAEALREINQKVENAMSVEGISRKIRAKMQGASEAELILKEAMPLTIQAIFLIHKASGLVISEVQSSEIMRLESEMVAGMLTAIRSFVNDCITQSGSVSEIDAIDYGNCKIMLEVAGYSYLAVVVQGQPNRLFIKKMRRTLTTIIAKYGKSIESFDGDTSTIPEQVNFLLQIFMGAFSKVQKHKGPPSLLILAWAILGLIGVPWGIYQYRGWIESRIEAKVALALASAPELSVYRLDADARDGMLALSGRVPNNYLRQKAAQIASLAEPSLKLDNKILAVEVPADPVVAASEVQRVTYILNQMDGVAISAKMEAGKVTVEGKVRQVEDAAKINQAFEQIPGVRSVINTVQQGQLDLQTRIYFDEGSSDLKPEHIGKFIQVKEFLNSHPEVHITIVGHSDINGNSLTNQRVALARAEMVRDALISQGIDYTRLQVEGRTNRPLDVDTNQPLWLSRCVEFEVRETGTKS